MWWVCFVVFVSLWSGAECGFSIWWGGCGFYLCCGGGSVVVLFTVLCNVVGVVILCAVVDLACWAQAGEKPCTHHSLQESSAEKQGTAIKHATELNIL